MITPVVSPVTGTVLEVLVKEGDAVRAGDELAIVESMKMEFPVQAAADCTVAQVLVTPAQAVAEGETLVFVS